MIYQHMTPTIGLLQELCHTRVGDFIITNPELRPWGRGSPEPSCVGKENTGGGGCNYGQTVLHDASLSCAVDGRHLFDRGRSAEPGVRAPSAAVGLHMGQLEQQQQEQHPGSSSPAD
jgi:hypothetical protein